MKKYIALLLVFVLAFSLCACGEKIDEQTQEKLDLYDKYESYIELLEEEKYEKLMEKVYKLWEKQQENNDPDDPQNPTQTDPIDEPTEEELNVLHRYMELEYKLYNYYQGGGIYYNVYDENGEYVEQVDGNKALSYILTELRTMDAVDKWGGTEYTDGWSYGHEDINWDRNAILAGFSKLSDVALGQSWTKVDHMENHYDSGSYWTYWEDGTIRYADYRYDEIFELIESDPTGLYDSNTRYYTYDDSGKITQIKVGSGDTTTYLVTPTYDANGNKINEHVKHNDGEYDIAYAYDAQNRLIQIDYLDYSDYYVTVTYTYDAAGNMVKEEVVRHHHYYWEGRYDEEIVDYKYISEYTYDASGNLVSGVQTYEDWDYRTDSEYNYDTNEWTYSLTQYVYRQTQDQYEFTCDAQGRPVTLEIIPGDCYYMYGDNAGQVYNTADYATITYEFVYGDYWFFSYPTAE